MSDPLLEDADGAPYPDVIQRVIRVLEDHGTHVGYGEEESLEILTGLIIVAELAVSEPWEDLHGDLFCFHCHAEFPAHAEGCRWERATVLMGVAS